MKKFSLMVSACLLTLTISACSSGQKAAPKEDGSGTGTTTPAAKAVTLKVGLPGGYEVTKKEIIDGFQAKFPNIKLDIDTTPWEDFATKIPTQIAGGNPPDIWFQENAIILGYGQKGVAEDLTPYIKKDLKDEDYVPMLYAAKSTDGKVYGIPHGLNPVALGYNKKLFTEANVPFPTDDWTYQDMIDAAKKLTKAKDGKTEVYGFISGYNITQGWFPWIKSAGGQLLDPTLTKAMVTDPKSLEGLKAWVGMNKAGISAPEPFTKAIGSEWQAFGSEKGAMYFVQYNLQSLFSKNFPNLDWDVVKMPKGFDGKRIVPNISNSWLIYSRAKPEAKAAAWEFLKYYLSSDVQDILATSGDSLPIKKSSMEKVNSLKNAPANRKAYTEGIDEAGVLMDENPSWGEWVGAAQPIFLDMYNGKVSVEDGAKQIQDKIQAVLDKK
jgi:multiple sugar transport system substrate-binding protein